MLNNHQVLRNRIRLMEHENDIFELSIKAMSEGDNKNLSTKDKLILIGKIVKDASDRRTDSFYRHGLIT